MYGLIRETSIKALFTAAFLPDFMLASFIIICIIIRNQIRPEDAPLPGPGEGEPQGYDKLKLFIAFLNAVFFGDMTALFLRALFLTVTGQNAPLDDAIVRNRGLSSMVCWLYHCLNADRIF